VHWEDDLIQGINNTFIVSLVESHSRYVMLTKLENKYSSTVIAALIKQSKKLPKKLYTSLICERGRVLLTHQDFTVATKVLVYFCDPVSP
jgi:IS30 family transposase